MYSTSLACLHTMCHRAIAAKRPRNVSAAKCPPKPGPMASPPIECWAAKRPWNVAGDKVPGSERDRETQATQRRRRPNPRNLRRRYAAWANGRASYRRASVRRYIQRPLRGPDRTGRTDDVGRRSYVPSPAATFSSHCVAKIHWLPLIVHQHAQTRSRVLLAHRIAPPAAGEMDPFGPSLGATTE